MFLNFAATFTVEIAESSLQYEQVDQNTPIRLLHVQMGKYIAFTGKNPIFQLTDEKNTDSIFELKMIKNYSNYKN